MTYKLCFTKDLVTIRFGSPWSNLVAGIMNVFLYLKSLRFTLAKFDQMDSSRRTRPLRLLTPKLTSPLGQKAGPNSFCVPAFSLVCRGSQLFISSIFLLFH